MPSPDSVHSIDELAGWPTTGTHLAVLGKPVAHSVSPAMHNAALARMAESDSRFGDWTYHKFEVDPTDLQDALCRFHRAGFLGLNLTVPHKVDALDWVAEIEPDARAMGAVNTLLRSESGWHGFNTDGFGLGCALRNGLAVELADRPVVLLGAGGAARAAAVYCLEQGCSQMIVVNRSQERLMQLRDRLVRLGYADRLLTVAPGEHNTLPRGCIVVQATSLGLKPDDPLPFQAEWIPADACVMDMIYNPAVTPFLQAVRQRGIPAVNGLSMLVWQGVRALEIWSGASVPAEVMEQAVAG